jgi:hypothetical protein
MDGFEFVREELLRLGLTLKSESIQIKKGHYLLIQGQPLSSLYWIKNGLLREFHDDGAEEFTNSFPSTGSFYLTGFYFGERIYSSFTVEALENSNIETLSLKILDDPKIEAVVRLEILKKISTIKYDQKLINGRKSFLHRWELFKEKYPGIWYETVQLTVSKFKPLNFDYERRQRRV